MARFASLLALTALLVGMPVAGRAADSDVTDDVARGRALAERLCATCHLGRGQGEKRSPTEIPGFAAVAKRPGQSLHGIVGWLKSIPPMMPNHRLTQDEMFLIAAYILSLQDEDRAGP